MNRRDQRRLYDKFPLGEYHAYAILKLKTVVIAELQEWLIANLAREEVLSVEEWVNERFYISVVDTRPIFEHPAEMRIFFTVDIKKDCIVWSTGEEWNGNCGVRTSKWKLLAIRMFGPAISNSGRMKWYENNYGIKKEN
jgi:hypothetical protein